MGNIRNGCALFLILIMVVSSLSLFMAKPANAQTATPNTSSVPIPPPAIPQFTVKYVNSAYEVPASSSINPYTGQNITTPSQYIENNSIQVIIKNQPFTQQWIQDGSSTFIDTFYYNIRMKGHFTDNWTTIYSPDIEYPIQSNSDYTVISYSPSENAYPFWNNISPAAAAQIDFQVQALIGAVHRGYNASATNQLEMFPWFFTGQTSNWSNTQTVTIPAMSASALPSATPTVPEFSPFAIFSLLIGMLSLVAIYKFKKRISLKK